MGAIFGWIAIGLIIGLVGKLVMPGRDPGGLVVSALLGMAGAILGGLTWQAAGLDLYSEVAGNIAAAAGAISLLALYRVVITVRR
ncbi:MAG: GlsB/YeaQ/YmgE family stress response membrane protein [Sphingomonadales bacterium]